MAESTTSQVLALLSRKEMTTEELRKELAKSRATVDNAVKWLRREKKICIVRYERTGVAPLRFLGIGDTDAPRPSPRTKQEIRAAKQARRKKERERLQQAAFKPRRDIAASWF